MRMATAAWRFLDFVEAEQRNRLQKLQACGAEMARGWAAVVGSSPTDRVVSTLLLRRLPRMATVLKVCAQTLYYYYLLLLHPAALNFFLNPTP